MMCKSVNKNIIKITFPRNCQFTFYVGIDSNENKIIINDDMIIKCSSSVKLCIEKYNKMKMMITTM